MPSFFKTLDKKKKMEIIRTLEVDLKKILEEALKQKREQILSKGYTGKQADEIIETIRDAASRKMAISLGEQLREGEKRLLQSNSQSL